MRAAAWSLTVLALRLFSPPEEIVPRAPASPEPPRFRESVEVERVLVDARVVDSRGDPIPGLGVADFDLRVDGKRIALESAQWVSAPMSDRTGEPPASPSTEAGAEPEAANVPGRLIVFFFQKNLHPSRIVGLFRMQAEAVKLLASLGPDDRVAVASYDSHLKLWLDFTTDRARLRYAIQHSVLFDEEPPHLEAEDGPSLAPAYSREAARRAATPETALLVLAEALRPLPGAKSMAYFGWGLGTFVGGFGVMMERDYGPALQALVDGRTTVFVLDVTDADYHTLEVGLETVAHDTGGFYAKTHLFPSQAGSRLKAVLAGYYVLVFEKPPGRPRVHSLDIRLRGRSGTVFAKPNYADAPAVESR
jgi:VWFA-related protein